MKLARREKYFIVAAICFIAVFFLLQLIVFPFFKERDRLQKGIQQKGKDLKEMSGLIAEYHSMETSAEGIDRILARRARGFTLFSFLEQEASRAQIKDHIKSMKPSTSKGTGPYKELMVEMDLNTLTLNQLVDYLFRIETSRDIIIVKRISITENKKETGLLDAKIQVMTFEQEAG
ncbi:MAG: type II secretion system protein M [Deltaproteobacteria bacterium]|nr:type II secretion system protein M [Deltaproteobacteria bacterium]